MRKFVMGWTALLMIALLTAARHWGIPQSPTRRS